MLVDLHTHSYYSDGTMAPREIIEEAKRKNIQAIAITDHDEIGSYKEAKEAAEELGVNLIRGVELDCKFEDITVHVLGYNFNTTKEMIAIVDRAQEALLETSFELIRRMEKDYEDISYDEFINYKHDKRKGGWDGIHYLHDKKITEGLFDGMKYYRDYDCLHVKFDFPTVEEACDAIHKAGGYAVLAHPCNYYKDKTKEEIIEKLNKFKAMGIDGVEGYYPANSDLMTETCVEFCKENDMIVTCGSDGHGDFAAVSKGIEYYIGAMKVDSENLFNIEKILK